jgi:hypothetical protein
MEIGTVAAEVRPAEVVGQDHDDVGELRGLCTERGGEQRHHPDRDDKVLHHRHPVAWNWAFEL